MGTDQFFFFKIENIAADMIIIVVTKELFGRPGIGNCDSTRLKKGNLLLRGHARLGK